MAHELRAQPMTVTMRIHGDQWQEPMRFMGVVSTQFFKGRKQRALLFGGNGR